jgi:dUTP pyrophosphatase
MHLQILPLNETARELYADHGTFHAGDSGLDLFIIEDTTIKAGDTAFLKLGFKAAAFEESRSVSWLILPRSSISKTPLRLANSIGLIDGGYRGELLAAVDNIKTFDFTVKKGERYFQAVSFGGQPIEMSVVETLDETSRGASGFGSTGVKKVKVDADANVEYRA